MFLGWSLWENVAGEIGGGNNFNRRGSTSMKHRYLEKYLYYIDYITCNSWQFYYIDEGTSERQFIHFIRN